MQSGQLYLANVSWRDRDIIADVVPGKLAVGTIFSTDLDRYEAGVPAYAREGGRDMQLAIRSDHPCFILRQDGERVPLARYEHPDSGEQWWIEKGEWKLKGKYHDAPSFHLPGGKVDITIGDEICRIHLYDPSFSDAEFQSLLDDIKTWCWKMAIDESCYVTVGQESEVKILSAEFLRFAEDFIKNIFGALRAPHCELRESVELQRIGRLKPNSHSIRFLAQRGERDFVPGRAAESHYDTPENRFLHGMLKAVLQMLRPQGTLAAGSALRFITTAKIYEERVIELRSRFTEPIDPSVLDENIRRSKAGRDAGFYKLEITNNHKGSNQKRVGYYYGKKRIWVLVSLPSEEECPEIYKFLDRSPPAMIMGKAHEKKEVSLSGKPYWAIDIRRIDRIECYRNFYQECEALEAQRKRLEITNWEQRLPPEVKKERELEANTLETRANALRSAANRTNQDSALIQSLIDKACSADKNLYALGSKPDLRFAPTMVFLQSPAYSGALSSYRQLRDLTGVDDDGLDSLLALEDVGLRDWPGVYERWCLVSLLKVLQDDFRFVFDQSEVRTKLLKYCTGKRTGCFSVVASRKDIGLELTLSYQPRFTNGRVPDFLLEILNVNPKRSSGSIRCVLDAKACNFVNRTDNARPNIWTHLDDCLQNLIDVKDYGEAGKNHVFIMHASQTGITRPTTTQAWAKASSYGGDAVYYWEVEGESGIVKPKHMHGAVMVRPYDLTHLKRLVLMLIQLGLGVVDICASCGSGGTDIDIRHERTKGGNAKYWSTCKKCQFVSVKTVCASCHKDLVKNQASWSYHDLHPTSSWNVKCWNCGTLL